MCNKNNNEPLTQVLRLSAYGRSGGGDPPKGGQAVQTWSFVLPLNFNNKLKLCASLPAGRQGNPPERKSDQTLCTMSKYIK